MGFTSYRQLDKSPFILNESNINSTISLLNKYDILCFLYLQFNKTISEQAEIHHRNINKHIKILFDNIFKENIDSSFYSDNCGCFANYWIMSKDNFNHFMEWSYPKVLTILDLSKTEPYFALGKHLSNSGFIIERLFIIWYMIYHKAIFSLYTKEYFY